MSMTMRFALLIAALIGSCSAAKAGASGAYSEVFALDWDGLRSYLLEKGIDFRFGYVSETSTNVQGGDKELWRYADQWTFSTTLDLQKLLGLNQAQFRITITDRNGRISVPMPILVPLRKFRKSMGAGKPGDGHSFGTIRNIWAGCWTGRLDVW